MGIFGLIAFSYACTLLSVPLIKNFILSVILRYSRKFHDFPINGSPSALSLVRRASAAPLSVTGLLNENAELVKLLRIAIRTGLGISRIQFSKNVINGHFVVDALIYRDV